jgi:hypothetical protein
MNKLISILLLIFGASIFTACEHQEYVPFIPWSSGTITIDKAGEYFKALPYGSETIVNFPLKDTFHLSINKLAIPGEYGESLIMSNIPLRKGTYPIFKNKYPSKPNLTSIYSVHGGDVFFDHYDVLENRNNFIEIISVDSFHVTGKFNVTLVRNASIRKEYKANPDTILFNCKIFDINVEFKGG